MKQNWLLASWDFTKNSRAKVFQAIVLSTISVFLGIVPYIGVYQIVEHFFNGTATSNVVLQWGAICMFAFLGKHVFFGFATTTAHKATYNILEAIRLQLSKKMTKLPLGHILNEKIGKLKNLVVDQVETIELPLSHLIPEGASYSLLPISIFIYLFIIDWRMALISLITIPLGMIPFGFALRSFNKSYGAYMQAGDQVNSTLVEYIEGLEVIKAFNQTGRSYEKFEKTIVNFKEYTVRWFKSSIKSLNLASAILPSSLIGTLPLGLYLYSIGELTVAEYILCLLLSMGIIEPLSKFALFTNYVKQIQYAVEMVHRFLTLKELSDTTERVELKEPLDIEVNHVSFRYEEDLPYVINDLSFHIEPGQFVAFVGPSGSGKSTIAKLLARFWDVTSGEILLNNYNIKDLSLDQLAENISFVMQDNFLFNESIMQNIRYGNPNATDEEVFTAAKAACCDEFIRRLENGYDTLVGEAGGRLSGGERQRIALARTILKNAPIVILDEATAFTDPENEFNIQQSIHQLIQNKTLIVIAHRLSTIKDADHIYVLKNGEIVECGRHEQLLANRATYAGMWEAHIYAQELTITKRSDKELQS